MQRIRHQNRRAYYDFEILEKEIAGIVLLGSEVRSIRHGKVSLTGSFCYIYDGTLRVKNLNISTLPNSFQHDPEREKVMLLTKKQLNKWSRSLEKGTSIVPLQIFENEKGLFKVEIGLARGKKNYDKRQTIKEREWKRNQQ
jgi:SsrA-binding protein